MSLFDRLAAADGVDPSGDAPRAALRPLPMGWLELSENGDGPWLTSDEWCDLTRWR